MLVALALLAAWPALHGPFIWDDLTFVRDNPLVQRSDGLGSIWCSFAAEDYWPLAYSVYWLEHRVFGEQTLGYHVVAVLLHALTGVMIWRVLRSLTERGLGSPVAAWLAAAWFVVHPVNVEVAAWIFQAKTSLCALLCFAAVYTLLRATAPVAPRAHFFMGATWVLFALSMLAKSSSVMLPPLFFLCLLWTPKFFEARRGRIALAGLTVIAGVCGGLSFYVKQQHAQGRALVRDDDLPVRLTLAAKSFWFYLEKALIPADLSTIYPRWVVAGGVAAWMPLGAMLVLGGVLWTTKRRWGSRLVASGLGYMLLMLVPCLGFVDISFMRYAFVADHWQYLAIIGPLAVVTFGVEHALKLRQRTSLGQRTVLGIAVMGLLGLTFLSYRRASAFTSEEALWRATIATTPSAYLAQNNLALIEQERGAFERAKEHYELALSHARAQVANTEILGGIAYNYAQVLISLKRADDALLQARAVAAYQPQFAQGQWLLADLLRQQGDLASALEAYRVACTLAPQIAAIHAGYGEALRLAGQLEAARSELEIAVQAAPNEPLSRQSLGLTYSDLGKRQEAVEQFAMAVRLAPQEFSHRMNLGFGYASAEAWPQATEAYQAAVIVAPERLEGHIALIKVLAHRGLRAEALGELERIAQWQTDEQLRHLHAALVPPASADPKSADR